MTGDEDFHSYRIPRTHGRCHRHRHHLRQRLHRDEGEAEEVAVAEGGGVEAKGRGHPRLFSDEWNQQRSAVTAAAATTANLEEDPFFKVKVLSAPPPLLPLSETTRSSEEESGEGSEAESESESEEEAEEEEAEAEGTEKGEEKGTEEKGEEKSEEVEVEVEGEVEEGDGGEGGKGEDSECGAVFEGLDSDLLTQIAGAFSWPSLWAASRVCRSWKQALAPLRGAMFLVHQGKILKHGRGGTQRNPGQALDCFLTGAARGCAAAMVDAGLLLWEMGRREDGMKWYRKAAELGDPAGQYNLGLAYLQEPSNPTEAVMWFHQAALAGHLRAQHSYALCLQQGRGVESSVVKAARWYLRAAEGGSARAMYNVSLCYSKGEGLAKNLREARHWMKSAALAGHRKAQFQHGLTLFQDGDGGLSLVFFELATRAGEAAAIHPRDVLLHRLSPKTRAHALSCADKWQVKQNSRP